MASRRNGSNSSRNSEATFPNGTKNGYGHSYLQKATGSNGKTVNGRGRANKGQRELYDGSTNVYYGYGGPFRLDNETDRSSEISERSDDFLGNYKYQPWMDKITGGTFRRDYLERISFRPTLTHDPSIPLQNAREFRHDGTRNINPYEQDPSSYKKGNNRNTLKKVLFAILVILLLGGIAGVLAWYFTIKGDEDTSINYYIVSSEIALSKEYSPELSDSSSQEFKNLSTQFCDAITEALRKNSTEYGDRYKHCEVTAFKNGSIIVLYKLFYVYQIEVQITKEKVEQDLNKSLTNVDPERAKLSDFVIVKASVKFTVEVQTFQTDPLEPSAQLITSTTELPPPPTTEETTTSEATTTTSAEATEANITTEVTTTAEATTTTETTSSTTKEATSIMAEATTTVEATTTTPPLTTTTSDTTSTTAEATTTKTTAAAAESSTTEATSTTPLAATLTIEAISTTADATTTTTTTVESQTSTTTTPPPTPTETTSLTTKEATSTMAEATITVEATTTTTTTTTPTTTTSEATSTTGEATTTTTTTIIIVESTTSTTPTTPAEATTTTEATLPSTTSEATSTTTTIATSTTTGEATTTAEATSKAQESTTQSTLATSTKEGTTTTSTTMDVGENTQSTTKVTAESSTPLPTIITSESTSISTAKDITASSTTLSTMVTTESSTLSSIMSTKGSSSAPSTLFTTESSTRLTSVATPESSETSTTMGTSESFPIPTTVNTTESSTSTTMGSSILTTKGTTETSASLMTQSSSISTIGTTEGSKSTTMVTTTISEQYTADVVVSPIIAIYGETTTTKTCVISPRRNWVYVTVTVENQGTPYVIGKYHSNKIFEEPASLEKFNASISSTDTEVVVYLSLDLQAPTTDMCSWDGKYTFSCSITMNDTISTSVNNGSQIFITAPVSDATIDSNVHYNEGDNMTFNCSSKGDPNHSTVYTELIKDSTVLQTITGPDFSSGYNDTYDNNCLVDLQWLGDSPNPLTTDQNDVIVRCVVKNTLLNESKTSEKRLNVSIVERKSSATPTTMDNTEGSLTSTTMGTTESSTTSTTMETTESSTTSTTMETTESSTTITTIGNTEISTTSTTMGTTESSTESTTLDTTESFTTSTTMETTESSTTSTAMDTIESSRTSTTMDTTESSTTSTTMDTTESSTTIITTPMLKYSADVVVSPVIAIYGETATTNVCAFTPHGDWLYATLTVEYQNTQYVIGKFHSNSSLEEPDSLDRFNISMFSKNMDIVVHLTMNLQTPTTDTCSLDGKYTFTCSITMNDTMQTLESNGSQIFITAPMSEISIDSEVHYNEGKKMTFNCSMKGDPNYSSAYVELIKNSQILYTIPGPMFGSDYSSDCSAVLNWSGGSPNPLTTRENDLIVRCVVQNKLLNETRSSEKKLNVSAADVAFKKYSHKALSSSHQEIECIARSPMSILQELIISKDDVQIATLNSSGVASSTDGRYFTNNQEYDGEVRLTLSIPSVECQDQGQYKCKLITTNNATRVSSEMSFIVEGSKPTMALHPDIYEPFARLGLNHVCSTEHVGDKNNDNFLEIKIFKPGSQRAFTYSKKIAEFEKNFDSTNNITYINITGTTAQFLLVSHTSSSSNLSCNIKDTITFLLDLTMEFDNGTIKCVLKDEMEEFSAVESTITVIPGNFCDGYEDDTYRKHPNNECNDYINCRKIQGKMYATGNQCPLGQCIQFTTRYCVPCDSTFTCDELTTPGPTTTTTTLPQGRRYVSCNDSAHFLGTTVVIRCFILDTSFNSLNITFLPEQSQNEEYVGELFPDGKVQSLPQSPVVLSANFDLSPKILMFTFQLMECSSRGRYRIIAGDTNSSVAPSVETFELNVLGNLTEFEMHIEPAYPEGTLVDFNCTASLDESLSNIKGYYKKESGSSFSEIEGSTTVIERNLSHCFVKVLWKPSTPFTADTSFNNADLKCELVDWPLVQPTKKISVQNADVAFETYKLESSIGSQVSVKCLARNTNSIKSILIRKIENSVNTTVTNVTLPDMTSHVDGTTVSYTNNSLTLTFSSLTCSDDGHYTCIVIKQDESEKESPAYLRVQLKNPPKHEAVNFILNPDIKENDYVTSNIHRCSGDVGYPSGLGYLSLKFTDPTTNASFTYDKLTVTEDMKTSLEPPLKFKVSLASGLNIIIVEDNEPDSVNCTRKKEIKFLLEATSDWNKAKIRCRVVNETTEVDSTSVEKEIYVIPDAVCDGSNGSDIYVPHEKIDECRTYIRCFNNKPTGQLCGTADTCFDHQKKYCNWCTDVACESEMSPTTEEQIITTYSTPVVPEIQCPLLSCNPTSVFEMETGNIVCELNTSMTYDNITVMKTGQTIMTVYSNGTNSYFLDNFEKYESTVGTSFTFGIKNVSCSDKDVYTFTVDVDDGGRCSKTASLDIKAKPGKPTLVVDYRWTEGTNTGTHSCIGDIGNPPGTITLEIKNGETGNFTSFSPSTQTFSHRVENCTNNAVLSFSIDFKTNNIAGHYIRCVAASYQQTSGSPFFSDEIRISPLPENTCFEDGIKPYPGECTKYLSCSNNITYVSQCGPGFCFSATTCITSNCDNICTT